MANDSGNPYADQGIAEMEEWLAVIFRAQVRLDAAYAEIQAEKKGQVRS